MLDVLTYQQFGYQYSVEANGRKRKSKNGQFRGGTQVFRRDEGTSSCRGGWRRCGF